MTGHVYRFPVAEPMTPEVAEERLRRLGITDPLTFFSKAIDLALAVRDKRKLRDKIFELEVELGDEGKLDDPTWRKYLDAKVDLDRASATLLRLSQEL